MNNPLISIIIPVYNVEPYLHQCLDSVINQTYKNLEIILIDDGSTDKSGVICDEYKAKDKRIIVIHQKNQGLSAARNAGLDICKGEYISFIDSDDYVDLRFIEFLYNNQEKYNSDMSVCGIIKVNKIPKKVYFTFKKDDAYTNIDFMSNFITFSVWNKLYKKSVFSDIRFPLNKLCEDSFLFPSILNLCKKVSVCGENLYYYRYNSASIMNNKNSKFYFDILDAEFRILSFAIKNNLDSKSIGKYFRYAYFSYFPSIRLFRRDNVQISIDDKFKKIYSLCKTKLPFRYRLIGRFPKTYCFFRRITKLVLFPIVLLKRCIKNSIDRV